MPPHPARIPPLILNLLLSIVKIVNGVFAARLREAIAKMYARHPPESRMSAALF
jgi:hypothetical protein